MRSERVRRLAREYGWIAFGQVLAAGGGLVGVRMLTGVLSPAVYGHVALSVTLATFAQTTVFMPLAFAFARYFSSAREYGFFDVYLGAVRRLLTSGCGMITLVGIVAGGVLLAIGETASLWLLLATYFFSIAGVGTVVDSIQNAARHRKVVSLHQSALQWLRPMLAVVIVRLLFPTTTNVILAYALASVFVLASQGLLFKRQIIGLPRPASESSMDLRAMTQKMVAYGWPFIILGLFGWVRSASDRWALHTFTSAADVGFYTVGFQLGYYPMMFISGSIVSLTGPLLFAIVGDRQNPERLSRTHGISRLLVGVSLAITFALTLFSLLFHQNVYGLLVAPEFRSASVYWPFLVLAGGFWASGQIASQGLFAMMDSRRLVIPNAISAAAGMLANMVGAYFWGIPGVIAGVLAFAFLHCVIMSLMLHRFGNRLASNARIDPQAAEVAPAANHRGA